MTEKAEACKAALTILSCSVDSSRRFPDNVFLGEWEHYAFFDSDWMFGKGFVELMRAVLTAEHESCACIVNLDAVLAGSSPEESSFIFDGSTAGSAYLTALKGFPAKLGWIYGVDRFACASESGRWSMYCERASELAVIALKSGLSEEVQRQLIDGCKALRIDKAIAKSYTYALSARGLSPEWRAALPRRYLK